MNDEQIDWPADLVTYSERAAYLRGLQAKTSVSSDRAAVDEPVAADGERAALLPCPFCGSENIQRQDNGSYGAFWTICDDCGACTGESGIKNQAEADAAWNRRAALTTQALASEKEAARFSPAEFERLRQSELLMADAVLSRDDRIAELERALKAFNQGTPDMKAISPSKLACDIASDPKVGLALMQSAGSQGGHNTAVAVQVVLDVENEKVARAVFDPTKTASPLRQAIRGAIYRWMKGDYVREDESLGEAVEVAVMSLATTPAEPPETKPSSPELLAQMAKNPNLSDVWLRRGSLNPPSRPAPLSTVAFQRGVESVTAFDGVQWAKEHMDEGGEGESGPVADEQIERALCAKVAEGETVHWYLEQAFPDDSERVRQIMVSEIVRVILQAGDSA